MGSKPKRFGMRCLDQVHDQRNGRLGLCRVDEVEVALALGLCKIRHLALVDPVRGGDDPALGGLAEHLGQAHDRDGARLNDVGQHLAGSH